MARKSKTGNQPMKMPKGMPMKMHKLGAKAKTEVTLLDEHDRVFTLEDGSRIELFANTPLTVKENVAKELVSKYPYLKVV